jgi:hypothetical protein
MHDALRVVMLGWLTAVLVAAPVVAARDCQACCNERAAKQPKAPAKSCCSTSVQTTGKDDCSHCPRCEASRPDPATPPQPLPRLISVAELFPGELPPAVAFQPPQGSVDGLDQSPINTSPPIRVRFCRWLT